jgi:hypothetical protein
MLNHSYFTASHTHTLTCTITHVTPSQLLFTPVKSQLQSQLVYPQVPKPAYCIKNHPILEEEIFG